MDSKIASAIRRCGFFTFLKLVDADRDPDHLDSGNGEPVEMCVAVGELMFDVNDEKAYTYHKLRVNEDRNIYIDPAPQDTVCAFTDMIQPYDFKLKKVTGKAGEYRLSPGVVQAIANTTRNVNDGEI